ncbi:MAG: ROK family protein [Rhodothermales bacterium]
MSERALYVGVDLGATNVRAGIVEEQNLLRVESRRVDADGAVDVVMNQIFEVVDDVVGDDVVGIGVGVPSVVDVDTGVVYDVQNIPAMVDVPFKERFEDRYGRPTYVNNDVNCFVLGEYAFGKAQGYRNVAGMNLGTGFAAGLIVDGRLYEGSNCGAGEFGMIPYRESILEEYCSGLFFINRGLDAAEMYHQAEAGDVVARSLWEEFGHHVGNAVKSVMYGFDPELIVVGGSIRHAYAYFQESMWATVSDFGFRRTLERLEFELSELDDAPLLGAAELPRAAARRGA